MARKKPTRFQDRLLASMKEAAAIARGEIAPARIVVYSRTARDVDVSPPPRFTAKRVQELRTQLQMSQAVFAEALNVSASLVRAWEQGVRAPTGPATRLMQHYERTPSDTHRFVIDKPTLAQSRHFLHSAGKKNRKRSNSR